MDGWDELKRIGVSRWRAADPTTLPSYKLVDLVFKLVQWTVFAGLVRAVAIKVGSLGLLILGWMLMAVLLLFVGRVTARLVNGLYRPLGFPGTLNKVIAVSIAVVAFMTGYYWITRQIVIAAAMVVSFYVDK